MNSNAWLASSIKALLNTLLFLAGLAASNSYGQTTGNIVVDGQGSTPSVTLQTNISQGNKAGETLHHIFGPYTDPSGDLGALFISTGQSPTGGKNDIVLYNYGCNGGCNVPEIGLYADSIRFGGKLIFPDGSVQTTALRGGVGTILLDGQGSTPSITLQTNVSQGNKAGQTQHQIFGPYNSTSDPGALFIGAGQSPTGGRNDIVLYNIGCNGGCNVPEIGLYADSIRLGGNLTFPDGSKQTTAQVVGPQGPQGPQGIQGPTGPQGPPGPQTTTTFSAHCAGPFNPSDSVVLNPLGQTNSPYCSSLYRGITVLYQGEFGEGQTGNFSIYTDAPTNSKVDTHYGFAVPRSGTLSNLRVSAITGGSLSTSGKVLVRKILINNTIDNNDVALTCTVGTATACNDATHSLSISSGERILITANSASGETLTSLSVLVDLN